MTTNPSSPSMIVGPSSSGTGTAGASAATTTVVPSSMGVAMRLNRTWDVWCPPAKKRVMFAAGNRLVPTVRGGIMGPGGLLKLQRKRRVAIEIHGPEDPPTSSSSSPTTTTTIGGDTDYDNNNKYSGPLHFTWGKKKRHVDDEPAVLPERRLERSKGRVDVVDLSKELHDDDIVYIRILKPRRGRWGFHVDHDDTSDSSDDSDDDSSDDEDDDDDDDNEHKEEGDETKEKDNKDITNKEKNKMRSKAGDGGVGIVPDGGAALDRAMAAGNLAAKWMQDTAAQTIKRMVENEDDSGADWIEYRRYGMDEIDDVVLKKNVWQATMGLGPLRERRDLVFVDEVQAQAFHEQLMKLASLIKERAKQRLEAYTRIRAGAHAREQRHRQSVVLPALDGLTTPLLGDDKDQSSAAGAMNLSRLDTHGNVSLLVEIVSASDLPIADAKSTDPYVIVFMGKQIIHRTKTIPKELNPVWTVDTGSLFIVTCPAEEFFSFASGLTFCIKDFDAVTSDEVVGQVSVSQDALLSMNGERVTLDLKIPRKFMNKKNSKKLYGPKLNLRVRKARPEDVTFMKTLHSIKRSKKKGLHASTSSVSPKIQPTGLVKKRKSKVVDGVTLHRVKPGPDPTRNEYDTKWLSKAEIDKEVMKPSYSWVEAGTGTLGKMYVEILKCDTLPNMDCRLGRIDVGLTDAFCCIIFEDSILNSEVIRDDLNPRWMPWSQRAFVFNVGHPGSQLLIGVFDYDVNHTGLGSHDKIGRISVDVTNFHPDTVYILTYNLFSSVLDNRRTPNGTLTIRLRLECRSFTRYALGTLTVPPLNHINLAKKSDFRTAYFVCNGEENIDRFSMENLKSYRAELESLVGIRSYVTQAVYTVLFWRGHKEIKVLGRRMKLPLHSVVSFIMGTTLIENFDLLPSYCFFCVAWLLAGTNELRQQNPSPWHGSMTIGQMWYALLFDRVPPEDISAHENEAAVRAYEAEAQRRQDHEEAILRQRQEQMKAISEFLSGGATQPDEIASNNDETNLGGSVITSSINPMALALLPIQKLLGQACRVVRVLRSIVMWDESYIAFSIVNGCIVLGIALLWVPWSFVLRWLARILIWTLLGPWMALVDVYILPKIVGGEKDTAEALRTLAQTELANFGKAKETILRKREDILKQRAMKRFMFGRFAVKVPRFKEYRYRDVPLPESTAHRRVGGQQVITVSRRSHGQTLEGEMIPTWGGAEDR